MSRLECLQALEWIDALIDGELEDFEAGQLSSHLEVCGKCKAHFDLENVIKSSVQRCCFETPAPPQLRARIVAELQTPPPVFQAQVVIRRTVRFEIREID